MSTITESPVMLACRLRLADGRILDRELAPERHRAIHIGLLHTDSDGYVELAAGRREPGGPLAITTRTNARSFHPGGRSGGEQWLESLLANATEHCKAGREVFLAPAVRDRCEAGKAAVTETRALWLDIDDVRALPAAHEFARQRPPHLIIETAGSGGARHLYWRLDRPLPATGMEDGARVEPIERAHRRLISHLTRDVDGERVGPDGQCKDRSRVLRLAASLNGKTRRSARIVWADLHRPGYPIEQLVGELPDPRPRARPHVFADAEDPYRRIGPAEYFLRLAGIEVPERGLVSCPTPAHRDSNPSCHVGQTAQEGWYCHGCGAGGSIYDLASAVASGPTGTALRGDAFRCARALVGEVFSEPVPAGAAPGRETIG